MQLSISTYAELITFIVSIITFKRLSLTMKAFSCLLLATVLIELGAELKLTSWHKNNNWIYNIFTTIEFMFYGIAFYKNYKQSNFKSWLPYLLLMLIVIIVLNFIYVQGFWRFHSYTFMVGSILITNCCFHYFQQTVIKENHSNFLQDPLFWVSIGLLIFYVGQFVLMMFFQYLSPKHLTSFSKFFRLLMDILNIIEYGSFMVAFIINYRKIKD